MSLPSAGHSVQAREHQVDRGPARRPAGRTTALIARPHAPPGRRRRSRRPRPPAGTTRAPSAPPAPPARGARSRACPRPTRPARSCAPQSSGAMPIVTALRGDVRRRRPSSGRSRRCVAGESSTTRVGASRVRGRLVEAEVAVRAEPEDREVEPAARLERRGRTPRTPRRGRRRPAAGPRAPPRSPAAPRKLRCIHPNSERRSSRLDPEVLVELERP